VNIAVPLPLDILRYAALLARIIGFLVLAPVTGSRLVPVRWRVLLAVATSVALAAALPAHWRVARPVGTVGLPFLAVLLGSELLVGIMVSLFVHILFEVFAFAGHVIGINMGFAFAQQVDPTLEQQRSIMSVFMTQMLTVVFITAGGIPLLLQLAVLSIRQLPPGTAAPARIGMEPLLAAVGQLFATGFQLALPIFCVTLLINVALGLMTRFGQDFEVLMLAFPVRIAVGFFVMTATVPVWVHLAARLTRRMFHQVGTLLQA